MKQVTLTLPKPHSAGQQEVLDWPGHAVVFAGRRWGKTEVGCLKLFAGALSQPGLYWWVGLSWRSASMKRAWRVLKDYTRQLYKLLGQDAAKAIREADKELRLPGGAEIWLRTAENAPSLAGEGVRGVVLDEFSLMQEAVWTEYVQATLLDFGGWALFIGVPKGQNWAANLWRSAHDRPNWRAWRFPTTANPFIAPADVAAIRGTIPERLFRQEYEADVIDDAGAVFRRVVDAATATYQEAALPGHDYVFGADWARSGDYTAFAVIDTTEKSLCYLDRFTGVAFETQLGRLRALVKRFKPTVILAEANSMGGPLIEQLQREGLPVEAFTTTNASKLQIVDGLALAFEQATLRILPDDVLLNELQAYEAERLPSGLIRLSAPPGLHDDTVIALALAWHAAERGTTWLLL